MTSPRPPRPRVFVFLQHGLSMEGWLARHPAGAPSNSTSAYGYTAASTVTRMSWSQDRSEGVLRRTIRRGLRRALGFDIVHAWRNRRALGTADVVWTHTEWESLAALAILWLARNRTTRVIAQSVWLWDEWPHRSFALRKLHLALLSRAGVEITHSDANKTLARATRETDRVFRVPFGAAINADLANAVLAEHRSTDEQFVLAVGSDRHRDWETMHDAARQLPDLTFRVATLSDAYPRETAPENVRIGSTNSLEEMYRLYRDASAVVLPLAANLHASGCTVAMEAQRFGRPLVTTDVGGLGIYLGREGVYLYETGSAASLASAIERALAQPAATDHQRAIQDDELTRRGLTADDYAARYVMLTRWLLFGSPPPEQAEQLTPTRAVLELSDGEG